MRQAKKRAAGGARRESRYAHRAGRVCAISGAVQKRTLPMPRHPSWLSLECGAKCGMARPSTAVTCTRWNACEPGHLPAR